ncbi:MAG: rhodanese-like domain-containing protein [Actinomycetia bacterium]|nr:rhodanese-like domain-containing protein [Actinomycetes bacterium]
MEQISVDDLAPRLEAGAVLLDVREPKELTEVRVPGVVAIPLGEVAERLADIPDGDELYVICRSGGRSAKACEIIQAAGRSAVNVAGGTIAWVGSGRPTESGG